MARMFTQKTTFNSSHLSKGFTLLELVVVILLVSILALFALDRVWNLRVEAEKATVMTVVGNIRSALGMEVAKHALKNELYKIPKLNGANPIPLLSQVPGDYIGEVTDEASLTQAGIWYYNPQSKMLIYRVRFQEYFSSDLNAPLIRLQVRLVYGDTNKNGKFDLRTDSIDGLDLISPDTYHWNIP